jgi:hypothetical protein
MTVFVPLFAKKPHEINYSNKKMIIFFLIFISDVMKAIFWRHWSCVKWKAMLIRHINFSISQFKWKIVNCWIASHFAFVFSYHLHVQYAKSSSHYCWIVKVNNKVSTFKYFFFLSSIFICQALLLILKGV